MIGIIAAMDNEVDFMRSLITERVDHKIGVLDFYTGKIDGHDIVLGRSGIGKVNGAVAAAVMSQVFNPRLIINTGCAGGMKPYMHIGDVVISDAAFHHDAMNTMFSYEPGQIPQDPAKYYMDEKLKNFARICAENVGLTVYHGDIGSGDTFLCDPDHISKLREMFTNMFACDMEAAGVGQSCYKMKTPCIIIRALSDIAGKESIDYAKFVPIAVDSMVKVVREFLKRESCV